MPGSVGQSVIENGSDVPLARRAGRHGGGKAAQQFEVQRENQPRIRDFSGGLYGPRDDRQSMADDQRLPVGHCQGAGGGIDLLGALQLQHEAQKRAVDRGGLRRFRREPQQVQAAFGKGQRALRQVGPVQKPGRVIQQAIHAALLFPDDAA
jgi:hypothetical protein